MKKFYAVIFLLVFVFFSASSAYSIDTLDLGASDEEIAARKAAESKKPALIDTADTSKTYGKTPFNKLTRGVFNMSTFYFEIPAGVMRVSKEKNNAFIGGTVGVAQGFFSCILRAVTGVFDTATFIIPPYNKPIMDPEYAVQSLEEAQP